MLKNDNHIIKTTVVLLIIAASLFCILFGQGTHFHDLAIHVGEHFDIHAHLHAHESSDAPLQSDHSDNHKDSNHQHEVSTASDIIGILTASSPDQIRPDIQISVILGLDAGLKTTDPKFGSPPTLFDLPPPRPISSQYYLSSFSFRGPPIA